MLPMTIKNELFWVLLQGTFLVMNLSSGWPAMS